MDKILIKPTEVESCWETEDACLVQMKTGKIWVCEKVETQQKIKENSKLPFIEISLKKGERHGK